jgi:hypothetical protein
MSAQYAAVLWHVRAFGLGSPPYATANHLDGQRSIIFGLPSENNKNYKNN